ncbi:hypothetical protein BOVATA_049890 [Babesia ovata]|uniref:Uncharacterized protein n=1 Tax=Babesia ovata TaxID=189622 RepID=A0A2H6KKH7_9APIC|nr:uncharacterized protein BOVATA_049890 [Babesia ovata]GBE63496.1 hypothetical protein BOVATA_049890 [Babesia ovata]
MPQRRALGNGLNGVNLVAETVSDQGTHVANDVTGHSDSQFTRLPDGVTVKETVDGSSSEEVTGTSGVDSLNTGRGDEAALAAGDDVGTFLTHCNNDSGVLGLVTRGKVLEVLEKLFPFLDLVKTSELVNVTSNDVRLLNNGPQVVAEASDADHVCQEGNQLLATPEGLVNHLMTEGSNARASEDKSVDDVVVKVIHNGAREAFRVEEARSTEEKVHVALGIWGNQGVNLAGELASLAVNVGLNTVVNHALLERVSKVIITNKTEEGSVTADEGVGTCSVGTGTTCILGVNLEPLTKHLENFRGDAVRFSLAETQLINYVLVDTAVDINDRVTSEQKTAGTLLDDIISRVVLRSEC